MKIALPLPPREDGTRMGVGTLRAHRHRLVCRLEHLEKRVADKAIGHASFDRAEISALKTALALFDEVLPERRDTRHWYAAQVLQSHHEGHPVVVTAILAYRSPEQAKAAVEAMHLVGAEGRDAYVWPPDEAATLSRLPRPQAAYRAIEDEVRRRWGEI